MNKQPFLKYCSLIVPYIAGGLIALLLSCSGEEEQPNATFTPSCNNTGGINIRYPTWGSTYTTTASSEYLAGTVNSMYPKLIWNNLGTGDSGAASLDNYRCEWAFPFPYCIWVYDWMTTFIPLILGNNEIAIDGYESDGTWSTRLCLTITRSP